MKKILSFLLVIFIIAIGYVTAFAESDSVVKYFDDLLPSQAANNPYMAVQFLYERGIVEEKSERTFAPNAPITREEFAKIIVLATDSSLTDKTGTFSDVETGSWYEPYVETANENKLMNAIGDGIFGVGINITREDAVLSVYRMYGLLGIPTEGLNTTDKTIADGTSISDYAQEAVYALAKLGTVDLISDKFRPKDAVTRGEACIFIYRMLISDGNAYNDRVQQNMPVEKATDEYLRKVVAYEDFEGFWKLNDALPSVPEVDDYRANWLYVKRRVGFENSSCLQAQGTEFAMFVEVEPSVTYNVDWMIKTEGMDGNLSSILYLLFYNSKGQLIYSHYDRMGLITTDTDWVSQHFSIDGPTPDLDPKYLCVIPATSGSGSGKVYFDNVTISQTFTDPLVTVMSSPNYKGLIYEENGQNDINVLVAMNGKEQVLNFEEMIIEAKVLDKDNNVLMHSRKEGITSEMSLIFSSKELDIGDYYLRIALIDSTTNEEISYDEWTLRKRDPDYRPTTYFDEYGRLVKNGKEMFVTGAYASGVLPEVMVDWRNMPLDLCLTTGLSAWWGNRETAEKEYEEYGTSFVFSMDNTYKNPPKGGQTFGQTNFASERPIMEGQLKYLNQLNNDSLFCYLLEDEYSYSGYADRVRWHGDILSELDIDRPTYGVSAVSKDACYAWYKGEDIHSADPYIIYGTEEDPIEKIYQNAKTLYDYYPNRPTWMVMQGCDLGVLSESHRQEFKRGPNEQEFRNQIWQAVCAGSQGVIWYSHYDLKKDGADRSFEEYWADIEKTTGELKELEDVILSVEDAPMVDVQAENNDMMCYTARRHDGKTYVIVVNMLHSPQEVSVTLEGAKSIYGIYSEKNYETDSNGAFKVELESLGVDIFQIEQEEYLSPQTDIKAIGFYNGNESYIVDNNIDEKDGVLNIPENLESVEFGINTVNDKIKVYVNGEKTEKSAKIDISGLDKLIFKVEAEDSRYYDEYVYEINRYSRDTLSVETPLFAGNSMTVNISSDSNTLDIRGTVLVALYEKESGIMKWCESREILNGQKQLTLTFTDLPDYAEDMELRVFVWKDLKTLQPIFKQKT